MKKSNWFVTEAILRGERTEAMIYLRDRDPQSYGKPVRICAQVNRDLDDISFRGSHANRNFHQVIELGSSQVTNTITSVQKDNIVWIEVFLD